MTALRRMAELVQNNTLTPCRAATTANIVLAGVQTLDTVALVAGDRVLAKDQTNAAENGVYLVSGGLWTRAPEFNESSDLISGSVIAVTEGAAHGQQVFQVVFGGVPSFGVTEFVLTSTEGPGSAVANISAEIVALANDLADLSVNADNILDINAVADKAADGTLDQIITGLSDKATHVSNNAALQAVTPAAGSIIITQGRETPGDGGGGVWIVRSGDFSPQVANDPAGGIWLAFDSDPDGDTIALQRMGADLGKVDVRWFGAVAGDIQADTIYADLAAVQVAYPHAQSALDQLDWLATQGAINAYGGRPIYLPGFGISRIYRFNRGLQIQESYTSLIGDGPGQTVCYYTHPSETFLYMGPDDPVATQNLTRVHFRDMQVANIVASPTGIGFEHRQCYSSIVDNVHLFGWGKTALIAGGIGNFYGDKCDFRADGDDTPPSDSYVMKFVASDRGVNGWQPTFSHKINGPYLGAEGVLDCVIELGMGDNLCFVGGYWKGGVNSVLVKPDGGGFGVRAEFTNVYQDGESTLSQHAISIPDFDEAGQNIGQLTFTGGLIANFPLGSHLHVEDPTAGGINFITFNGTTFGNCGGASADVTNTARDLHLSYDGCVIRDCGGGIGVNNIGSLTVSNTIFEDIRDDSGIDHIHLAGSYAAKVIGCHTRRLSSGAAGLLTVNEAAALETLVLRDNTDHTGARQLVYRRVTLADNAAASFKINLVSGFGIFRIISAGGGSYGDVWFRTDGATQVLATGPSAIEVATNTVLSGTTGTDGKLTLSYVNADDKMYIENRLGTTFTFEFALTH